MSFDAAAGRRSGRAARTRWRFLLAAAAAAALGVISVQAASPGDRLRARLEAAPAGAEVRVAAGRYDGPFTLSKPVRLLGEPGAILEGNRTGCVVAIRAPDVELAGFTIRGSGRDLSADDAAVHITSPRAWIHDNRITDMLHGIYVKKAHDSRITDNVILGDGVTTEEAIADPVSQGLKASDAASAELCAMPAGMDRRGNGIHLWNTSGHVIANNTIRGTRDGVYFSFASQTEVLANRISQVRYGLHYMYSDDNSFERNEFSDSAAGAALMFSRRLVLRSNRFVGNRSQRAYGLLLQGIDDTRVEDNVIAGNTLGLFAENGNGNTFRGNQVTANYVGLRVSDSTATSRFFENSFAGNIHPVETTGENGANDWAVAGRGNYWESAVRLDLNRDGVADVPHFEPDLFGSSRRAFPAIGLLSASPGERLLRWIQSRLALSGVPGIADPKPLTHAR